MDGRSTLLAQNAREKWGTRHFRSVLIASPNLESQPSKGATAGAASSVITHGKSSVGWLFCLRDL
jgi:hypothetical protein